MKRQSGQEACPGYLRLGLFSLILHPQASTYPEEKTLGLFQQPPAMNGVFLNLYTSDNFSSSTYLNFAKVQSDLLKHAKVQIFSQNLDV